jgi:hypothetical protein
MNKIKLSTVCGGNFDKVQVRLTSSVESILASLEPDAK